MSWRVPERRVESSRERFPPPPGGLQNGLANQAPPLVLSHVNKPKRDFYATFEKVFLIQKINSLKKKKKPHVVKCFMLCLREAGGRKWEERFILESRNAHVCKSVWMNGQCDARRLTDMMELFLTQAWPWMLLFQEDKGGAAYETQRALAFDCNVSGKENHCSCSTSVRALWVSIHGPLLFTFNKSVISFFFIYLFIFDLSTSTAARKWSATRGDDHRGSKWKQMKRQRCAPPH